jgi:hypothetical protein
MDTLIQTEKCSIIYGTHDGKENQELFRCPRELDDKDLPRYINENRSLVGFVDDSDIDSLYDIEGKKVIGYFRMYYRDGWAGTWLPPRSELRFVNGEPDKRDCLGVNNIINWIESMFPRGCDHKMKDYFEKNYNTWGVENRYLISPLYSEFYKVAIDTTYGNGDYPVRIYLYH